MSNVIDKDQIFTEVRDVFASHVLKPYGESGMCLYWAACGYSVLRNRNMDVILQAGGASFPTPEGRIRYIFQEQNTWRRGEQQSIHVWLAIPSTREIVDFSYGQIRKDWMQETGEEWSGPDYLWFSGKSHYEYLPHKSAIKIARDKLLSSIVQL